MKKLLSILSLFCFLGLMGTLSSSVFAQEEENLELAQSIDENEPISPANVEASEETMISSEEPAELQDTSADLNVESGEEF